MKRDSLKICKPTSLDQDMITVLKFYKTKKNVMITKSHVGWLFPLAVVISMLVVIIRLLSESVRCVCLSFSNKAEESADDFMIAGVDCTLNLIILLRFVRLIVCVCIHC